MGKYFDLEEINELSKQINPSSKGIHEKILIVDYALKWLISSTLTHKERDDKIQELEEDEERNKYIFWKVGGT